jgi:hypothetical protein
VGKQRKTRQLKRAETLALLLGWEPIDNPKHIFKFVRELRPKEVNSDSVNRAGIVFGVDCVWATNPHDIIQYETNRVTSEVTTE